MTTDTKRTQHWHIWRKIAPSVAQREPRPFFNTNSPSRIIRREARFAAYGGRAESCDDERCLEDWGDEKDR